MHQVLKDILQSLLGSPSREHELFCKEQQVLGIDSESEETQEA